MRRRRRLAVAVALAAAAAAVLVIVLRPSHDERATLARPDLQRILDELVAQKDVAPGAVAAVLTPRGTWVGAAGFSDLARKTPAKPDDWFRIASLTKSYTAALVRQLVSERKLGLEDTVGERLPDVLPAEKSKITIRQLLTHSSGLYDTINDALDAMNEDPLGFFASLHDPAYAARVRKVFEAVAKDPTTRISPRAWVDVAAREPLYFPPGEGVHYTSTGYVLLGWIVEKATHASLGEAMEARIFRPLGLKHTRYVPGPDLPSPFMHAYVLGGAKPDETTRVTLGIAGASAVAATAEDAARYYQALLAGRVVPTKLLEETMLPEQMGIGPYPTSCGSGYGHTGAWWGYLSWGAATNDGRAVAVFLNGNGAESDQAGRVASSELLCAA